MGLRITPATCPLEAADGTAFVVRPWLRQPGPRVRSCIRWCRWEHQRDAVRLVAAQLPPEVAEAARRRRRRKAQKDGRQLRADTLELAGWVLLLTTLPGEEWTDHEILRLYRVRWQVEVV